MRLQHSAIFGCAFPPSSLPGPHILGMEEMKEEERSGEAGSHQSAQGCLLCLSLSLALVPFLCLSLFLSANFSLSFFTYLHISILCAAVCAVCRLSIAPAILCLLWFPCGPDRERERERGRGRDDLVEGDVSSCYYFSSSALLFSLSPPHYVRPSGAPQQSPSSLALVLCCDGAFTCYISSIEGIVLVWWFKDYVMLTVSFIFVVCVFTGTCLHALMFKKLCIFLTLPVLQHLFSPSVWNQSLREHRDVSLCRAFTCIGKGKPPKSIIDPL